MIIHLKFIIYLFLCLSVINLQSQDVKDFFVEIDKSKNCSPLSFSEVDFSIFYPGKSIDLVRMDMSTLRGRAMKLSYANEFTMVLYGEYCIYGKKNNGRWVVINYQEKLIFEDDFLDIQHVYKGYFLVRNDEGNFGIVNVDGKVVIPFNYRFLDTSNFKDGFVLGYLLNGQKQLISSSGFIYYTGSYVLNKNNIYQDNYYGLISKGYFIHPVFDEISVITEHELILFTYEGKKGILNNTGIVFPAKYDSYQIINNNILFKKGNIFLNKNMQPIFSGRVTECIRNADSDFFIKRNNKWEWLDINENPIRDYEIKDRPRFFRMSGIYGNIYYYTVNGENFYFNRNNTLPEIKGYSNIEFLHPFPFYRAERGDSTSLLDRHFIKIVTRPYEVIFPTKNNLMVDSSGTFLIMDTLGLTKNLNAQIIFLDTIINESQILQNHNLKYYKFNEKFGIYYKGKWTEAFIDRIGSGHFLSYGISIDKLFFKAGELTGFITEDTLIFPTVYSHFADVNQFIKGVKLNTFDVLDTKGNILLHNLDNTYISDNVGYKNGSYILYGIDYNKDFHVIQCEDVRPIDKNFWVVKKDGKYGVFDKEFNKIVNVLYHDIKYFFYDKKLFFVVTNKNGKQGLYDIHGSQLMKVKYDEIYKKNNEVKILYKKKDVSFDKILKKQLYESLFID